MSIITIDKQGHFKTRFVTRSGSPAHGRVSFNRQSDADLFNTAGNKTDYPRNPTVHAPWHTDCNIEGVTKIRVQSFGIEKDNNNDN